MNFFVLLQIRLTLKPVFKGICRILEESNVFQPSARAPDERKCLLRSTEAI